MVGMFMTKKCPKKLQINDQVSNQTTITSNKIKPIRSLNECCKKYDKYFTS